MSEDFTVSILANDINRDCTGQYHFRNKISKSDQKEKDEADSRLAPKFHPATTRPRLGVVPSLRGETYRTWPIAEYHSFEGMRICFPNRHSKDGASVCLISE